MSTHFLKFHLIFDDQTYQFLEIFKSKMSYLAYVCGVKTVFGCSSQLVRADAVIASDRISKFPVSLYFFGYFI